MYPKSGITGVVQDDAARQRKTGCVFLYNLYTAFVTISVLVFVAIYNTSFITVVTLGGTVLGSAAIGFCSSLLVFLLRRLLRHRLARYAMAFMGNACIIRATAACLPGWNIDPGPGTILFMSAVCALIVALNEYILSDNGTRNGNA